MENLRDQIFQVTNNFLVTIQQLTEQHATLAIKETFSSLGDSAQRATPAANGSRPRGAKRGANELEQLSNRFVQFVHDNPGLRIEQINKQLDTTTTELALPIRKLIAESKITVKGQKRSTTYFAGKGAVTATTANDGESTGEDKTTGKSRKKSRSAKKSRSSSSSRSRSRSKSKK